MLAGLRARERTDVLNRDRALEGVVQDRKIVENRKTLCPLGEKKNNKKRKYIRLRLNHHGFRSSFC